MEKVILTGRNGSEMDDRKFRSSCWDRLRIVLMISFALQTLSGCLAAKSNFLSKSQPEPGEPALQHKLLHKPDRVCLVRKPTKPLFTLFK